MKYDNTEYWQKIHEKYKYSLKTVGHPHLSEALNQLKYRSETKSFQRILKRIHKTFSQIHKNDLSVLDVGTGTGYWSDVVHSFFVKEKYNLTLTALDISEEALSDIKERNPFVTIIHEDLKTIPPKKLKQKFDLVICCYCLHHIINLHGFINALNFAGECVKSDGFLIIMDPILTLPYSKYDVINNFPSYDGNGIPRHLYIIDDVLNEIGLSRQLIQPAVSFLLNDNIEGSNHLTYASRDIIWKVLSFLYKSDRVVTFISFLLLYMDSFLKNNRLAFSSSVCLYRKISN